MNREKRILFSGLLLISMVWMGAGEASARANPKDRKRQAAPNYRQSMRNFVKTISATARRIQPGFLIITQGGQELLTADGSDTGAPVTDYLKAINGVGQEDVFYGYTADNRATPPADRDYLIGLLNVAKRHGKRVLVTDYCWTHAYVDKSYSQNATLGFLSFAANHRALDAIPTYPATPYSVNANSITSLAEAKNLLYLINPGAFSTKTDFLKAVQKTNYDILLIDLFFNDNTAWSASELLQLKKKANGGTRLVISYMSIGEAENYRFYWQSGWKPGTPTWLGPENPDWAGNFAVRYWDPAWQKIIATGSKAYLKRILNAGFDGVYLDKIDEYEFWEGH